MVDTVVELRGAPLAFYQSVMAYNGPLVKREVLCAGPGGTGKSRGFMQVLALLTENTPGMRGLLTRGTRESMTSSTLVQWERCFPDGHKVLDGPQREGRSIYHFQNGAEVAAIGLDKPGKLYSTEWDWIYGEELTGDGTPNSDIPERTWGLFFRGLRGPRPFRNQHFLVGTCNPSFPDHWVKQRIDQGGSLDELEYRFDSYPSRIEDNPVYHNGRRLPDGNYDPAGFKDEGRAYNAGLRHITSEYDRRRLLKGEWCAAEGLIWPNFDKDIHVLDAQIERKHQQHWLHVKGWEHPVAIEWYFVSMDFGYSCPGVLQVWAVDGADRLFRVAEVYYANKSLDWWADKLVELHKLYPFDRGVGDSAEPRTIEFFNDRLGHWRGRGLSRIIHKADKSEGKKYALDQVRWGFDPTDGGPRIFLLKDAFPYGKSEVLARARKPLCLEDEIVRYTYDGLLDDYSKQKKEKPDRNAVDHAADTTCYGAVFAWKKRLGRAPEIRRYAPGTYGDVFRYKGEPIPWPKYA